MHKNTRVIFHLKAWKHGGEILMSRSRKMMQISRLFVPTSPAQRYHVQMWFPLKIAGGVISPG